MKKMWKRFVSLLLACTLLAGMLPLSASAASEPGEDSDQYKYAESILQGLNGSIEEESSKYNLVGPVSLGDSELYTYLLTRYYIPDGTTDVIVDNQYVIVPGEGITDGNMPDYDSSEDNQPWVSANASAIYIAGGVTGIGRHAFNGMDTLEKVVFQDASDLTYVGSYAFNGDNKAQFTDEGNSGAAGDDPTRILDLSHVEKMGENAFYNCDGIKGVELSGNITAVETKEGGGTEEINHKIPNHAFESCNALTSITVPEGITTIGTAAFAGCTQASSITLPDSLVTIEDRAFMCSIDGANRSLTSLTIPENVETIGASAFYGYKALATVTVESTVLEEPGDAAFGNSAVNAYATTTTITDAESGITYEDVTVGTQFYTPSNAIKELFENEYNCYLGDLTPLEYANTVKATCEKNGYHVYRMTITDIENAEGQHPTVESRVTIPAVGHNYEDAPDRDATCTLPGYHVQVCTNKKNGLVVTCEAPEKLTPIEDEPRLRHSYRNISVENPGIAADNTGNTVVTYTCANYSENEEENHHDGELSPSYSWEIQATTLTASTTQTLGNLTLPAATGKGNSIAAELTWADGVDTEELLGAGTHDVQVKLKITGAPNQFADYLDEEFTIRVQVEREPLDFSKVEFQNATRYVGRENGEFEVIGMPTDTEITTIEFRGNDGKTWGTQAPAEDDADDQGKYLVRVTFIYEDDKYLISDDSALQPGEEYTLEAGTTGTGTITGTYEVRSLTAADLKATTINGLVYDAKEKATVRVEGLPKDAEVKVTWTENEVSKSEEYTATTPALEVAKITNAGEYDVRITVTHGSFDGDSATVTAKGVIAKQTVETPVAKSGLDPYTPTVEQTGVPDSRDESIYTITGNKAIDAGTHTATAELVDKNNYKWSRGDEQETGTVTIPFTILKHSLQKPVLSQTSYVFDNQEKAPLTNLNEELTYTYDTDGKLSATWKLYPDSVAYTATNAQKTDAETYKVTVALSDPQNYQWTGGGTDSYDLTWSITPMQVIAPTVTVTSPVTYDGQPYNSESKEITFGEHSENSGNILKLGSEHKYYRLSSGGTALSEAPTNAGTYYVQVDFDFKDDLNPNNYTITGNNRRQFRIEKAELTLTEPTENLSVTYTGSDLTVPAPQVEGLQKDDTASDYSLVYTYTIGESEVTQSQTGELKLRQVGTYHISVSVSRECTNYTSNTVEYVFTISTANQTVKLTGDDLQGDGSADAPYTISKTLGNDPFTVTGKGYVNDVVVNEDDIGYEVTGGDTQNPVVEVDPTRGEVTLLRAGRATITVTAEGSANYQAATASYTITVGKGTPTVEVQMPEDGSADNTYPYTGKELSFTATVTGAGNGAVDPTTDKRVTYNFYSDNSGQKGNKIDSQPTKIGTYWVEAVYAGDDNYNPKTSEPVQFTISPAALKVEATGYSRTYDGGEHDPASITVTGVNGTPFTEDDYTVSYIEKGSDGEEKPGVDDPNWDSTLQVKDVADSGDYWIKVVIDGDDSSYAPYVGEEPITVTISPRPLEIERKVTARKPYDGKKEATVEFKTINTGVDGETVKVTDTRAEYNSPNVEHAETITITYKLTAEPGTDLANYSLDGEAVTGAEMGETVTEGVGITPASITVAINDQTSVYDGEEPDVAQGQGTSDGDTKNWYVSEGTIYNSDNLGITLSIDSDSDAKDAGAYAIIGKWTNSNYTVTFTGSWKGEEHKDKAGTYTITPRPIDVKIGDAEGFYGDAPDLTLGTKVILTPETAQGEEAGLVNGENIYGALEGLSLGSNATVSSSVGENYTIYPLNDEEPVLDDNGTFGNYNVTFTNEGTYTVKQRPITITIEDQESDYGCEIAKLAYSETLSNTYTGSNKNVVFVGDDEDELGITLSTTAKKGSDAGTYPISGMVTNTDLAKNYMITWEGQTPYPGNTEQATYTVEKADLAVEFTNETVNISMGGQVENPLKYINASNGNEDLSAKPDGVTVTYSSSDPSVAEVNSSTGKVTLVGVGDATITAKVTEGGDNFNGGASDTYVIHVAQDGGLRTTVTPVAGLTYTGEMQDLVTYTTSPEGATVTFTVTAQESGDQYKIGEDGIPQALDAGTYTVSWRTTLEGYREETGSITVTVAKADPSKGFTSDSVSVAYEENKIYDSTEDTNLQVEADYAFEAGNSITYLSDDTQVAQVEDNNLETIRLNSMGTAHISARFAETENFQEQTVFFTLTVGQATTMINYTAEDYKVTYDGQAHGSQIIVTSPSEYTIKYSNNQGASYDLDESPTITNAGSLTIYFQIQADGYQSVSETQTVTVEPKPIEEDMIAGIAESYTYVGHQIIPETVAVVDDSVILTKGKDYTIDYGENTEIGEGTGSVTISGMGNYMGSVTKNFTISPVDASDLTASLNRTFGYYGDSNTNNATVTVTHGRHTVDSSEIELTVIRQDSTIESGDVVQEGLKLTFNKAGIYKIHVEVAGTHTGAFDLTYTLLPQDVASDDFQVATDPVDRVWTYDGENRAFGVTVTSGGTSLQKDVDFTLRYTYLPYVGNPTDDVYDPGTTAFTEAGIYTVIVEGTGNYTGHAELVALIQPRDLSDAGIAAAIAQTGLVYNGEAQEPDVTLTYNGAEISQLKDTEYYGNTNAGEAQALSAASEDCNNFTGARVDAFTIEKKSLKDSTITAKADPEEYYYTGYPVTPAVTVTDSGRNVDLSIGADYTVTSDAVGPGKVTATVTGTGNYKDTVTVEFTILPTGAEPVETLNLTVTPSEWTWDNGQTKAAISVTFNGKELNDTDYQLTVSKDGETPQTVTKAEAVELLSAPGEYTITATGMDAYAGSTDTETVTIQKIQPTVTVTATPNSLSGGGKVTLTLKGEKLPAFAEGKDLSDLLTVTVQNGQQAPDLTELEWTENQDGSLTAELTLPNTNETYTFALSFVGNDYYESASSDAMVVVGQQTSGGGGGSDPGDQPADPDDTGVSDWLNTKDHLAYLAGYPGGTFGPDQNMTRAEAAQMFYNLLLEKDVEITVEFEDVPADAWYAKPVNTLASLGILSGVGNGRFDPERSITRAEFTVIAMKFANTSGGGVNIFSDVNEDDWFYSAVVDSTQYGWINGYPDGTFRPEATISRAEVTVIVNHMLGRAADRPYVIAHEEELNTFGDVNRGHWGYFHVAEATNAHEYHTEDGTESWTGLS